MRDKRSALALLACLLILPTSLFATTTKLVGGHAGDLVVTSGTLEVAAGSSDATSLTMGPEAVFIADLYETFWATNADYLTVRGPISLDGAALDFTTPLIFPGQMHTILRNEGTAPVHGTFAGLPEGTTFIRSQVAYRITYRGGTSGRDVVVRVLAATDTSLNTSSSPAFFGSPVTITASIRSYALGIATGAIELFDGINSLGTAIIGSDGLAKFTFYGLAPGTHVFTAHYAGDGPFGPNTSSHQLIQEIYPAAVPTVTTLTAPLTALHAGQTLLMSALVQVQGIIPPGTVTFYDGTTALATVPLDNTGKATLATVLPGGTHQVHASYGASYLYQGSTSNAVTATWETPLIPTKTTLLAMPDTAKEGSTVGLLATVQADSGAADGTVRFVDGSKVLGTAAVRADQTALLNVTTLPVGDHQITAFYEGNERLAASNSAAVSVHIEAKPCLPPVILVPPADAMLSADGSATLSVVTDGSPTETIQWFLGAYPDVSHPLSKTAITKMEHLQSATFVWVEVANICGSVHASAHLIPYEVPDTVLHTSGTPAPFGSTVTIDATVRGYGSAIATGSVELFDGLVSLGTASLDANGVAKFTLNGLTAGTHVLTAHYAGQGAFGPNTSSHPLTQVIVAPVVPPVPVDPPPVPVVPPVLIAPTVTTLSSPLSTLHAGQTLQLTAVVQVQGLIPSGTVTFYDGAAALGTIPLDNTGKATLETVLPGGTHLLHANYNGAPTFQSSTSNTVTATCETLILTRTALRATPDQAKEGSTVVLRATVQPEGGAAEGTVRFVDGSKVLGTATVRADQTALLTVTTLPAGDHQITAFFQGNDKLTASNSAAVPVHIEAEQRDCAPVILVPPADAMLSPDGAATLSVVTDASPTENVQWFLGAYPDASQPLGTTAITKVENLRSATDVWVQVTNVCGSAHASAHLAAYAAPHRRAARH